MPKIKKSFVGKVVSNANDKTVSVEVLFAKKHPIYKKSMKFHKKFAAHDSKNQCQLGDIVKIVECRPLSATKRFYVQEIKKSNKVGEE